MSGPSRTTPSVFAALLNPAFIAAMVVLIGSAGAIDAGVATFKLYLRKLPIDGLQVRTIPAETAHWSRIGTDERVDAAQEEALGTSNHVSRVYVEKDPPKGRPPRVLQLHLAYYTGMVDTVPHVPERCMVGGGWSIGTGTSVVPVPLETGLWRPNRDAPAEMGVVQTARIDPSLHDLDKKDEREKIPSGLRVNLPRGIEDLHLRVTDFKQPGADRRLFAGYFFIANGGVCDSAERVRLLAFDLKADYAFYLKVQVSSETVANAEELAAASASLLDELLPEIMLCVPDWVRITAGDYPPDNPRRGGARGGT